MLFPYSSIHWKKPKHALESATPDGIKMYCYMFPVISACKQEYLTATNYAQGEGNLVKNQYLFQQELTFA